VQTKAYEAQMDLFAACRGVSVLSHK
jgi:hypothetical protein